jgi:small-conductance mechanosensitive channel
MGTRAVSSSRRLREHEFVVGTCAGVVAVAALIVGSEEGGFNGPSLHPRIFAWVSAGVLLVAGVVASRSLASGFGGIATKRTFETAGAAVRFLLTGVGFVIVLFGVFAVLGVSVSHLLIGAGLAGIVLGIAAQQTLGNVFAAIVLLFARPFAVGDHIRIRSGAMGGLFDVWVLEVGLTYVTVRTDDGVLKLPNSAVLAAGIGQLPRTPDPQQPTDVGTAAIDPTGSEQRGARRDEDSG